MYHNRARLLRIERWAKRLARIVFFLGILVFLAMTSDIIELFTHPDTFGLDNVFDIYSIGKPPGIILSDLMSFLQLTFTYLSLQGISKAIRYLIALKTKLALGSH